MAKKLKEEISKLTADIETKETVLSNKQDEIDALQKLISSIKEEHEKEKANLSSQLTEAEKKTQAETKSKTLQSKKLKKEITEKENEITKLNNSIDELRNLKQIDEASIEALKKELIENESAVKLKELTREYNELKNNFEDLSINLVHREGELHQLKENKSDHFLDCFVQNWLFSKPLIYSFQLSIGDSIINSGICQYPSERPTWNTGPNFLIPLKSYCTIHDLQHEKLTVSVYVHLGVHETDVKRLLGEAIISLESLRVGGELKSSVCTNLVSFSQQRISRGSSVYGTFDISCSGKQIMTTTTSGEKPPSSNSSSDESVVDQPLWLTERLTTNRLSFIFYSLFNSQSINSKIKVFARIIDHRGSVYSSVETIGDYYTDSSNGSCYGINEPSHLNLDYSEDREYYCRITVCVYNNNNNWTEIINLMFNIESFESNSPITIFTTSVRDNSRYSLQPSFLFHMIKHKVYGHTSKNNRILECRLNEISPHRPLNTPVQRIIATMSIVGFDDGGDQPNHQQFRKFKIYKYQYDCANSKQNDFSTFLESNICHNPSYLRQYASVYSSNDHASTTPSFNGYVIRSVVPEKLIMRPESVLINFYQTNMFESHPQGYVDELFGFTMASINHIVPDRQLSSLPEHKSYLLNVILLANTTNNSTQFDCDFRVWPDETMQIDRDETNVVFKKIINTPRMSPSNESFNNNNNQFALNHEMSVQLMKEFNLRAAALRKAGEEIQTLNNQIQVLKRENDLLNKKIENEKIVESQILRGDISLPFSLDKLTGEELRMKLHSVLEKYREEKRRSDLLSSRIADMDEEINRFKEFKVRKEKLEKLHIEESKQLQRLQKENGKIDNLQRTIKSQEKIIDHLESVVKSSQKEIEKNKELRAHFESIRNEKNRLKLQIKNLELATVDTDIVEKMDREIRMKNEEIHRLKSELIDVSSRPHLTPGNTNAQQQEINELKSLLNRYKQRAEGLEKQLFNNNLKLAT